MRQRSALVIGGGIGGLTAAAALDRRGWSVTVLERTIPPEPGAASETRHGAAWGPGSTWGTVPLSGGRIYAYATAAVPPGGRAGDERAELLRRFGNWHHPFPPSSPRRTRPRSSATTCTPRPPRRPPSTGDGSPCSATQSTP
ncbi:FAD-dependent oxidoreductase [Streptomyces lydicus]|nr:FAD-dependent oxidoreductase [Streptomyces lydicus]